MRLIFLGSPEFAVPALEALRVAGHEIGLVVSQPDRPAGRGRQPAPPPVAAYARAHGLPLWQTGSVRGSLAEERLRTVGADGMALAAFAALIPDNVLALTQLGILNVHPSLLPRWRGAAPIQAALLAGDTETGVSILRLVRALDAGPVLLQERVPIAAEDDYVSLEPRLAEQGARLVVRAFAGLAQGSLREQEQDDGAATYCARIDREDGRIDWSRSAEDIWRQVRAYRGWPTAFTTAGGRTLKINRAWPVETASGTPGTLHAVEGWPVVSAGEDALRLDEVVPEGKRAQSGAELLRGYSRLVGTRLGT